MKLLEGDRGTVDKTLVSQPCGWKVWGSNLLSAIVIIVVDNQLINSLTTLHWSPHCSLDELKKKKIKLWNIIKRFCVYFCPNSYCISSNFWCQDLDMKFFFQIQLNFYISTKKSLDLITWKKTKVDSAMVDQWINLIWIMMTCSHVQNLWESISVWHEWDTSIVFEINLHKTLKNLTKTPAVIIFLKKTTKREKNDLKYINSRQKYWIPATNWCSI